METTDSHSRPRRLPSSTPSTAHPGRTIAVRKHESTIDLATDADEITEVEH